MVQKSRPVEFRYPDCIQQGSINVRLRKNCACMETNIFVAYCMAAKRRKCLNVAVGRENNCVSWPPV